MHKLKTTTGVQDDDVWYAAFYAAIQGLSSIKETAEKFTVDHISQVAGTIADRAVEERKKRIQTQC